MPNNFDPIVVDEARYRRFSDRNTAFNVVPRRFGKTESRRGDAAVALLAEGLVALKRPVGSPEEALFQYGWRSGVNAVRELTDHCFVRNHPGSTFWNRPHRPPPEVLHSRCQDPERLTREVRRVARRCGAARVGATALDPRWVYADVQRTDPTSGETFQVPIHIRDVAYPIENADEVVVPREMNNVLVVAVRMDRDLILSSPSFLSDTATNEGYSTAARCVLSVARFIQAIGYRAIPALNDLALTIPMAVQAGLGEQGRNGLLITPEYGSCVRLAKVITDMPLVHDAPRNTGIGAYCEACERCVGTCHAGAIPSGPRAFTGHNACNNDGVRKWHVDTIKCLRYWHALGTSCSVCIAVCPFTMGGLWGLGGPRWLAQHAPRLNRAVAWLDRTVAPRRRRDPQGMLETLP